MGAAMTRINDLRGKEQAFSSVARRFPQAEFMIRRLMRMSEDFYDLCGELAEAEHALAQVLQSVKQPEEREREWQELINCLVVEIGEALAEHGRCKPGPGSPD
jgi:hypothetical protein